MLTREQLAVERAAYMVRQRIVVDAAIEASRARQAAYEADPTHRVPRRDARAFIQLTCRRCETEFTERRRQGRPHLYCAGCRS